jgi:hypothetical protein
MAASSRPFNGAGGSSSAQNQLTYSRHPVIP